MIFYLGGGLLLAIALLLFILAPRNLWDSWIASLGLIILFYAMGKDPNFAESQWLSFIFHGIEVFVNYIAPSLLLIFGLAMFTYALSLFQEEHNYPQLVIGLSLAVFLILVGLVHYYVRFNPELMADKHWLHILDFVVAYYVLLLINFLVNSLRLWLIEDDRKQDYIIILGCLFNSDNTVSKMLKLRLDACLAYVGRQKFLYHHIPILIVSGAATVSNSDCSEADVMAQYLKAQGIPEEKIWREDQATNTHGNFAYSKQLIERIQPVKSAHIAFITSAFHLYRSQLYANLEGLYQVTGFGAKTTLRESFKHGIREFVAILFMHRKLHLLMTVVMFGIGWLNYIHFD
ncbi:YdcF family protein [Aerococcus sp. JJEM-2022a]|uniref:YdcF family protein n=1 Tax=Aerococcus loyolae TaxID=2976809 RepID=A0ABT4C097_9LACT|nr:YdcF family protein [Aerococcus loyolae]MCY3025937.1 YdcF family protein [Aerococcus loyolae]